MLTVENHLFEDTVMHHESNNIGSFVQRDKTVFTLFLSKFLEILSGFVLYFFQKNS